MSIKRAVKIISFSIVLITFVLVKGSVRSDEYLLDQSFKTIEVKTGEIFTIKINGRGWYINRYSDKLLVVLLRTVGDTDTSFKIKAVKSGEAYIFFSHVKMDRYVRLVITENKPVKQEKGGPEKFEGSSQAVSKRRELNALQNSALNELGVSSKEKAPAEKHVEKSGQKKEAVKRRAKVRSTSEEEYAVKKKKEKNIALKDSRQMGNTGENILKKQINVNMNNKTVGAKKVLNMPKNAKEAEKAARIKNTEKPHLISSKSRKKENKKTPEIYYIDETGKKVTVKTTGENDKFFEGKSYYKNRDFEKAADILKDYLKNCEECKYRDEAEYLIADSYLKNSNDEKAYEYFKKIQKDKQSRFYGEAVLFLGRYAEKKKEYRKAVEYYREVFGIGGDPLIAKKIADISYSIGNTEEAIKFYTVCLEKGLKMDDVYYKLARIYDSPGKYRDIQKAYNYYLYIVNNMKDSKFYNYSEKRVKFFERNFINFR